jgi:phage terminase small subunit
MAATEKQKLFAQKYVELGFATEAYRAVYSTKNMNDNSIRKESHLLLKHPNVSPIVNELREKNAKRNEVTIDIVTEMLREDRALAHKIEAPAPAVSASMGLAKIWGLDKSVADEARQQPITQIQIVMVKPDDPQPKVINSIDHSHG